MRVSISSGFDGILIMTIRPWLLYAILSAVSAAFIGIFAKIGMAEVDSNLATVVRSIVMTLFLVLVCTVLRVWSKLPSLHGKALLMIVLSGVAGATSWLFYFRAIRSSPVSKVAPIDKLSMPFAVLLAVLILGEQYTAWNWVGIVLIMAGAYLASYSGAR